MAATRALVEKLKTLYKETGGEKDFDEEQRVMFSKAVGTFDARKVIIVWCALLLLIHF